MSAMQTELKPYVKPSVRAAGSLASTTAMPTASSFRPGGGQN